MMQEIRQATHCCDLFQALSTEFSSALSQQNISSGGEGIANLCCGSLAIKGSVNESITYGLVILIDEPLDCPRTSAILWISESGCLPFGQALEATTGGHVTRDGRAGHCGRVSWPSA